MNFLAVAAAAAAAAVVLKRRGRHGNKRDLETIVLRAGLLSSTRLPPRHPSRIEPIDLNGIL